MRKKMPKRSLLKILLFALGFSAKLQVFWRFALGSLFTCDRHNATQQSLQS